MSFDVIDVTRKLIDAGLPVVGVTSEGRIDFTEGATQEQVDQAYALLASHDQAAIDRKRAEAKAKLEATRAANAVPIDPTVGDDKDAVIQVLVKKVAWLEQEILNQLGKV
jgi:hypothetical protein